jgi:hypothetical protein
MLVIPPNVLVRADRVSKEARAVQPATNSLVRIRWIVLSVLLFSVGASADAQQAGKVFRIGRLGAGLSSTTFGIDLLRRELRELGYIEGKNTVFEFRHAEEKRERVPFLANELVQLKIDILVAGGCYDCQKGYQNDSDSFHGYPLGSRCPRASHQCRATWR